ncbi:DUF4149 domain-containing protein [Chloracidobacterium sp. MS 40/45]|uniref:DUF4149 domain-containing protein n=1 Tax=Chloracidobacterium aggregatum TaxID=2851959 RepID=UPI001B8CDD72|nr:DUF4149 domain-containing protein [Chloracidobacterium aggregatum]QUW00023.1 DUF4149 domain-containing protein [Chloracidobacterium sp. MS 40/45]
MTPTLPVLESSPESARKSASHSAASRRHSSVDSLLGISQWLVLALWLGAMVFFSAAVAPSAFGVLPTRYLAGTLVNSVLGKLEWWGLVCGVLLTGIQAALVIRAGKLTTWAGRLAVGLPVLMTVVVAISKFVVSAKLAAIRGALGSELEKLPLDDPTRMTFAAWHQYSVWLMGFNILAAVALIVVHHLWLAPTVPTVERDA